VSRRFVMEGVLGVKRKRRRTVPSGPKKVPCQAQDSRNRPSAPAQHLQKQTHAG
jgi:hypothetical protein